MIGAAPDGDSVRFTPTDPRAWARAGVAARVNATGGAQLRLDGIDAHETHHTPPAAPAGGSRPPWAALPPTGCWSSTGSLG